MSFHLVRGISQQKVGGGFGVNFVPLVVDYGHDFHTLDRRGVSLKAWTFLGKPT